jgi:predicted DNA-binding transcriptional regulator YafY
MERIYKLDRLFRRRRPPSRHEILDMFEISPAQFKRDLEYMRNRLGAPVTFDMEAGGYRYTAEGFNLPGLWFTEREVYSLLLMHSLLDQLQPGFVREQLGPFKDKLRALLGKSGRGAKSILEQMQVQAAPQRPIEPEHFQAICDATLRRKKLRMRYYSRSRGAESDRVISPQRVIYYRGNWYLDAWCHEKEATRRFAIDAVRLVSVYIGYNTSTGRSSARTLTKWTPRQRAFAAHSTTLFGSRSLTRTLSASSPRKRNRPVVTDSQSLKKSYR